VDDHTLSGADYIHSLPAGDRIISWIFNFHIFFPPVARLLVIFQFRSLNEGAEVKAGCAPAGVTSRAG
jgi:hypothetical protein